MSGRHFSSGDLLHLGGRCFFSSDVIRRHVDLEIRRIQGHHLPDQEGLLRGVWRAPLLLRTITSVPRLALRIIGICYDVRHALDSRHQLRCCIRNCKPLLIVWNHGIEVPCPRARPPVLETGYAPDDQPKLVPRRYASPLARTLVVSVCARMA